MELQEFIPVLFQVLLIPLLGILTKYIVAFVNSKISQIASETDNEMTEKYLTMLKQTITECVIATNQTYVSSLKEQGKFDAEAQKEAFKKTYDSVMQILSIDAKNYLHNCLGDLDKYVNDLIEADVNLCK